MNNPNSNSSRDSGSATTLSPELRRTFTVLLLGSGSLLLLGQNLANIVPEAQRWLTWIFKGFGLIFFALASLGLSGQRTEWIRRILDPPARWLSISAMQVVLLIAAPLFSFGAFLAAGDKSLMRDPWIGVGAWVFAIVLVIAASRGADYSFQVRMWPRWEIIIVVSFGVIALALRVIYLDKIPWLVGGDEGAFGLGSLDILNGVANNIFATDRFSYPRLYFAIPALAIAPLGNTIFALRLSSAVGGALTVIATYWYARHAFSRAVAILATAYLIGFHYHIHFSRLAISNVWDALFMTLIAATVLRAWQSERKVDFAIAGILLGISQYFYASSRVLAILLPLWLFVAYVKERQSVQRHLPALILMLMAAIVTLIPLAAFFIEHPGEYFAPFGRFTILGDWLPNEAELLGQPIWQILASQFTKAALGYTEINILTWYNPDNPMLLTLPAVLFILGVVLMLARARRLEYTWLSLWLLSSIGVIGLALPTPAAQRYVYVAPVVAIVVVLPLAYLLKGLPNLWPNRKWLIRVLVAALLVAAIVGDLRFYFDEYAPSRRFGDNNTEVATRAGEYLSGFEEGHEVYFFGPPRMGFYSHATIPFLAPQVKGIEVFDLVSAAPDWELRGPTSFIFLPERADELGHVLQIAPNGELIEFQGANGEPLFFVYEFGSG